MGQVIRFTAVSRTYPAAIAALDVAERLLLGAVRWWVVTFQRRESPLPQLCADMADAGVHDAAFSVDTLMAVVACTARRTVDIHRPQCAALSEDEQRLLHAASLAQAGDSELAEQALRSALLTAQGAEFALGTLTELGDMFAMAGLFFPRRRLPRERSATEAWTPDVSPSSPKAGE